MITDENILNERTGYSIIGGYILTFSFLPPYSTIDYNLTIIRTYLGIVIYISWVVILFTISQTFINQKNYRGKKKWNQTIKKLLNK